MFSSFSRETRLRKTRLQPARRSAIVAAAVLIALAASTREPARAATYQEGAAMTAMPGGKLTVSAKGDRIAVVSATDTDGDALTAQRALLAAQMAVNRTRGMVAVPDSEVAKALQKAVGKNGKLDLRGPNQAKSSTRFDRNFGEPDADDTRVPMDSMDFKELRKNTKADRAMAVYVTRVNDSETAPTVRAVVEMYETKNGGLIGRGEATYTATVNAPAAASEEAPAATDENAAPATIAPLASTRNNNGAVMLRANPPIVNGTAMPMADDAEIAQVKALGGAVYRAVAELNRPIELNGVVLSMPLPYMARLSLGTIKGLRNGARIEYLDNGRPVAYGMVTDVGAGEALATVAPEAAFNRVFINMQVRNVSNPIKARMGQSLDDKEEKSFSRFERDFGVGLAVAGLIYLGTQVF